jgi:chromosomal replication initiation ATPase DnaA
MVCFPERDVLPVFRDAIPEPRPTPVPESGVRAKVKSQETRGALRRRILLLEEIVSRDGDAPSLKRRVATLEAQVKSLVEQLKSVVEKKTADRSRSTEIAMEVCRARGVTVRDLRGRSHAPHLVEARVEVMRRLASELGYSPQAIAKVLGRNRTTIIYHMRAHKEAA